MLKEQLDKIKVQLKANKNQNGIVSHLQYHPSFVTQSEQLDDYFAETDCILSRIDLDATTPSDEQLRIAQKLIDQVSIYTKLTLDKVNTSKTQSKEKEQTSIGKMHSTLAQYRQYLTQFDDKLRQLENSNQTFEIKKIEQRRKNCVRAIEQLEFKITKYEQSMFTKRRR